MTVYLVWRSSVDRGNILQDICQDRAVAEDIAESLRRILRADINVWIEARAMII